MYLPPRRAIIADQPVCSAPSVRDLPEQLSLHVNEPEPIIIRRTWQFALNRIIFLTDYVVEEYKLPKNLAKEASR